MVSLDSITDNAKTFVRDVLRNNLTDTQATARTGSSWIFKGMPEKRDFDAPFVVITLSPMSRTKTVLGNNHKGADLAFNIEVWADKIADRDDVGDEILKTLRDHTSQDSGGTSLQDENMFLITEDSTDNDVEDMEGRVMRRKIITAGMVYGGS